MRGRRYVISLHMRIVRDVLETCTDASRCADGTPSLEHVGYGTFPQDQDRACFGKFGFYDGFRIIN